MHTPAVAHDMHKAHPLDALGRGTLATYALESAEADCLPTAADRLAYPSADAPLFALAMTAALRDAGALCDACPASQKIAVRNRACSLVPRSSFLLYLHSITSRDL